VSYTALYRKFRPAEFEDVKGQDHIVTTLKNQITGDRIGHAYLFCGTRGTGKTTVAKIFAKAVNCEAPEGGSPCGHCASCISIQSQVSTNVIEIDAASNNSVDNVREIREEVAYRPTEGKYKVYIIDEAHMLTTGAFNALLKTLEEPPEYVIFILATTETAKIPVTILSRCQRYDFRRISADTICERLAELLEKENVAADEAGLKYISRLADGSMRDALSLLDQCISCYIGEKLTYDRILSILGTADTSEFSELMKCVKAFDAAGSIKVIDRIAQEGREMNHFVNDLIWYLRNILMIRNIDEPENFLDLSKENIEEIRRTSADIPDEELMRYIRVFSELSGRLRTAAQKRIEVEMTIIRLCRPQMEGGDNELSSRIRALEVQFERGIAVRAPVSVQAPEQEAQEADKPAEKQKPLKAAPEDLLRIKAEWPKLCRTMDHPLREFMTAAELNYESSTGDSTLYIRPADEQAEYYLSAEGMEKTISSYIENAVGKAVTVEILKAGKDRSGSLAEIPLEERLSGTAGIPINIVD